MSEKTEKQKKQDERNRKAINDKVLAGVVPPGWVKPRQFKTTGDHTTYRDAYLFTIIKHSSTYLKVMYKVTVATLIGKSACKVLGEYVTMTEAQQAVLKYNRKHKFQREEDLV